MTRLSHSAISRYSQCPRSYRLHYIDKIRESVLGSPLFLGMALDEALNEMLKTKIKPKAVFDANRFDSEPTNTEQILLNPYVVFQEKMKKVNYNREDLELPFTLKTRYSMADYDADLILPYQFKEMQNYLSENNYESDNPIEVMDHLQKFIRASGFIELEDVDKIFYNLGCWFSLVTKGLMMLKEYKKTLLPQIEEVISIQRKVDLPNSDGDNIIGYIDFTAKLKGKPGVWTCDNKSSSRKYKEDSVKESQQLCIYSEFEDNDQAAFFVINKKVRKTKNKTCKTCGKVTTRSVKSCPEGGTGKNRCGGDFDVEVVLSIDTQIIADKITEEQKDLTFSGFDDILFNIREGNFEKVPKDECFSFGRRCAYYERCYGKNPNSLEGLIDLNEKS